jgi:hypothetical protein
MSEHRKEAMTTSPTDYERTLHEALEALVAATSQVSKALATAGRQAFLASQQQAGVTVVTDAGKFEQVIHSENDEYAPRALHMTEAPNGAIRLLYRAPDAELPDLPQGQRWEPVYRRVTQ